MKRDDKVLYPAISGNDEWHVRAVYPLEGETVAYIQSGRMHTTAKVGELTSIGTYPTVADMPTMPFKSEMSQ